MFQGNVALKKGFLVAETPVPLCVYWIPVSQRNHRCRLSALNKSKKQTLNMWQNERLQNVTAGNYKGLNYNISW